MAGLGDAPARAPTGAEVDDVVISVHSDPDAIEQIWRGLERRGEFSAYQRFDWVRPWCRHAAPSLAIEPTIVLASVRGRPMMLLPLGRRRTRLGTAVEWLGGSHVNIGMPLINPDFRPAFEPGFTQSLFKRIAAALAPADYFCLSNQPEQWGGMPNPLQDLRGRVQNQPVIAIPLDRDFEAMLNARKRKKLRWQENTLAQVGGYRFYRAATRAEAENIFDVFLAQKRDQFAKVGIRNVFADPGTADAVREMIGGAIDRDEPVIELYGLSIDGKIRATFAGGIHARRMHGYFSGISLDEHVRVSPGELLLHHLIRECCSRGLETLDLGVGDERYKSAWPSVREPQFSTILPISFRGRLGAAALAPALATRVRVRRSEAAWRLAKGVRRWRARLFGGSGRAA